MLIDFLIKRGIVFGLVTVAATNALFDNGATLNSCPPRFYGEDCRKYCPHPFFGNQCKGKCECGQNVCHYLDGCPPLGVNCPLGFSGKYCETPCKFPHYGFGCQHTCLCPKTKCDFSTGCLKMNNIYFDRSSQRRNITTTTQRTGINESKNEGYDNMNADKGFSRVSQSYFRTTSDDFVNDWTGKPLPKHHLPVNKNTLTQYIVISVGVVLFAMVLLHVLLTINNCIKRKERITFV